MKFDPKPMGFALATTLGTVLLLEVALVGLASVSPKVGSIVGSTPPIPITDGIGCRLPG